MITSPGGRTQYYLLEIRRQPRTTVWDFRCCIYIELLETTILVRSIERKDCNSIQSLLFNVTWPVHMFSSSCVSLHADSRTFYSKCDNFWLAGSRWKGMKHAWWPRASPGGRTQYCLVEIRRQRRTTDFICCTYIELFETTLMSSIERIVTQSNPCYATLITWPVHMFSSSCASLHAESRTFYSKGDNFNFD